MNSNALTHAALLAVAALVCGLAPPFRRMGERALHAALAAATGIFLGVVFLELLPSLSDADHASGPVHADVAIDSGAADPSEHAAHDGHHHVDSEVMQRWIAVLAGLLVVYLVESLALRTHDADDRHRHRSVAWGALLGLSLQAIVRGIDLASSDPGSAASLAPDLVQRGVEAFALATIFTLAAIRPSRVVIAIAVFAALTPIGLTVGCVIDLARAPGVVALLGGFSAGIFLFVSLCELLPEVFHHREDGLAKIALLAAGIGAVVVTV